MKYVPILGVSVRHTYYTDQRCPDFVIKPSADTERLARNHRLILRIRPDGVTVAAAVDQGGDMFIALSPSATFVFQLRVNNPDFALFTNLEEAERQAAPRYTNGAALAPYESLSLGSHQNPDRLPRGLFATAEIAYGAAASPAATGYREFGVEFTASHARWSYYCITDLAPEAGKLTIYDAAGTNAVVFGSGNTRDVVARPDPADPIAGMLAERYPNLRRLRFISDELVASRDRAHQQLELRLDGERVTGPLPNPKLNANSKVEVIVDGNPREEASRYHIVKYPDPIPTSTGG